MQKWMLKIPFFFKTFNICSAQMSGSGVRQQIPDVLSSAQLKNLELKSLTNNFTVDIYTQPVLPATKTWMDAGSDLAGAQV